MTENLAIATLAAGLLLGVIVLCYLWRRVRQGKRYHTGVISICSGFASALPWVLMKLGAIEETGATVAIAFVYFFVFIIGPMRINSILNRRQYSELGR